MHGKGGIHMGVFQNTGVNGGFGTLEDLLAGLKQQLDGAGKRLFPVLQKLGKE